MSNDLSTFLAELGNEAQSLNERLSAVFGSRIKIGRDSFTLPNEESGEVLQVVILDFNTTHTFYDRAYVAGQFSPPACFAIGTNPDAMVPSQRSPSPQSEACSTCPQNVWGSGATGRNKACKNVRVLAVITEDALDNPDGADVMLMTIPPTSIKAFDKYVADVRRATNLPPIGVVTEISLVPKAGTAYSNLAFKVERRLGSDELSVLPNLRAQGKELLLVEPDVSTYEAPKGKPVRR